MQYYSAAKKEWNNAICSNIDGPRDDYTKWSKSEQQISYDITYMWNLKKEIHTNLLTKQKQLHRHRKQTWLPKGKGGERNKLEVCG